VEDNFRGGYGSSRTVIPEKEEYEDQGYESHWCDIPRQPTKSFFFSFGMSAVIEKPLEPDK
jgi:hypothetical protein